MKAFFALSCLLSAVQAVTLSDCPGYKASNVKTTDTGLTADLGLNGATCGIYGRDLHTLKLIVEYQTDKRLHVVIQDGGLNVFQIQEDIIPRPANNKAKAADSDLEFSLIEQPFSFKVKRRKTGEVLFDTTGNKLVFETQFLHFKTNLPANPNLYGLGEHTDSFRFNTDGSYRRTLWNREAPFVPRKSNLYGSMPMYIEHRDTGTHGVLFLNSNGMDINMTKTTNGHSLEYNTLGGIADLYFFSGPDPTDVSKQHAEAFGLPAMMPYWSLGFHQAKYGYWDVNMLAEVAANYSTANIPLEVVWADIDYMDYRKDFTLDPLRFPLKKVRELVSTLKSRDQRFVMMLDPGISNKAGYAPFTRGHNKNVFLKTAGGSDFRGVQWAGVVVWPDYHSQEGQQWWKDEILSFFNPDTGVDVDGIWNDMNEPSNFCPDVNCDPVAHAKAANAPPEPKNAPRDNTGRPIPGFPASFQPKSSKGSLPDEIEEYNGLIGDDLPLVQRTTNLVKRADGDKKGLNERTNYYLLNPFYRINNAKGDISKVTVYTNITNHDGTKHYDTHNLYGLTMTIASYKAMLARRPTKRPFVLTRSTFLTTGVWSAHWFGDNYSSWDDYRFSISQMLTSSAVHNMPMTGSDVCGFNGNVKEGMCARWAMLSAFQPFMRNHAEIGAPHQEFYLWSSVTKSAQKALDARYRLMDYIYTALHMSSTTGSPSVYPLFFLYPQDKNTYSIQTQWFLGNSILICPVVTDDGTSVAFYLPDDIFYDFWTLKQVKGEGKTMTLNNLSLQDIPVYYRGGTIVPQRSKSAMRTASLRGNEFTLFVAPGKDDSATGSLILDDGESLKGSTSDIQFSYKGGSLSVTGSFAYKSGRKVEKIVILGADGQKNKTGSWSLDSAFSVSGF
ncbi:unnamed protein product [Clonostachys rhizophaga]|uniref:alpha-glucosidase n=1 Tax=Clonostachys rhizophaga TaxID=160324 RepID=A0A9N9VPF2_9HYPO|nr:unnamed protein product [Clonostachys rhizophaga]